MVDTLAWWTDEQGAWLTDQWWFWALLGLGSCLFGLAPYALSWWLARR